MSESFMEKLERMWPTHGRVLREDYLFPPRERFKCRLRRLLSRRWRFGGWRWRTIAADWRQAAVDPLRYQDCVRRRNEYLDLFGCRREPFLADKSAYDGEDPVPVWFTSMIGETGEEMEVEVKSPGGAKQQSPEAPAPVQQEKSNG